MAEADGFDLEKPVRELTKGVLQGLWDWFRGRKADSPDEDRPRRGILIIGSNGTGKTTLARFLSGRLNWLDDEPASYRESPGLEHFSLPGGSGVESDDSKVEIVVAPGQDFRRPSTWPMLKEQVAGGAYRGVVVVNAFGYHNFSTPSYKNHQLYKGSKPDFWDAYLADRREEELRVLNHLVPHLAACRQKIWLLSAITKLDLWSSQQRAVEEHYLRGDYHKALVPVSTGLGDHAFRHEVAMVSLIILNLQTLGHELLAATGAGYDVARQLTSIRYLVDVFAALRSWEGGA